MENRRNYRQKSTPKALKVIGRIFAVLGVTLLMLVVIFYGVLYVALKGPSPTMKKLVTLSLNETSAIYWFPRLVLSQEEVDGILASKENEQVDYTNADLIHIDAGTVSVDEGRPADETSGEETPGEEPAAAVEPITVEEVHGSGYSGYMMIVQDPSRVILGTPDTYGGGSRGLDLWEMVDKYGAVAAINAGGFYDPDGTGNGGIPEGLVIYGGELKWGNTGSSYSIVGIDDNYVLYAGTMTGQQALDAGIQYACTFGPALVVNGVAQNENGSLTSGVNPRTAIGQRADGAILMLVIDGRQVQSMGATYDDLVDIMLAYGAVNASNLDGGSSTMMIWNGELLNTCASVYGPRPLATAFVVLPE